MAIEWQRAAFEVSDVEYAHRGTGLGKWLVACVLEHPEATRYLEIHRPDVYKTMPEATS